MTKILREQGFAVCEADKLAHKALLVPHCTEALKKAFGDDIVNPDGSVDRRKIAMRAFSCEENTLLLNSITHPVIKELSLKAFDEYSDMGYQRIIFDAPTLFESGLDSLCHKIVAVVAEDEVRLSRIMKRDNLTEEEAKRRMSAQKDNSFYMEKADFVIDNSSDEKALRDATLSLLKGGALL